MIGNLLALILGVAGLYGWFSLPDPYGLATLITGVFAALLAVFHSPRKVVVRYGGLSWDRNELCRHFLITGDTGVGKTSSGFAPLLIQITKSIPNWGGLVLGVKGDEHEFARELCEGQGRGGDFVNLQVRPESESTRWKPPHRYNLLSDRSLPWTTHAKAIVDTGSALTEGSQSSFFKPAAQQALANVFRLLDELEEPVTLKTAYQVLTSSHELESRVTELAELDPTDSRIEIARYFDDTFLTAKAHEQKEGIIGTIKIFLAFFQDEGIAAVFASDESNTLEVSDVDDGMILAVSMPQRFSTERRYINTYLKTLFYYHALRRFDKTKREREGENLLLGVFDEFQGLVTAAEDGLADHNIVDRVRSAGMCLICGMQSEVSADPVIGRDKRKVLALNMRTRFIFRAADAEGAKESAEFLGKKKWKKKSTSIRGGFFMGSGITRTRREEWDYKIQPAELMELKDHTAYIAHPNKKYIRRKIVPRKGNGTIPKWYRGF